MIKSTLFSLFATLCVSFLSFTTSAPLDGIVMLPAGTALSVKLNQTVEANEVEIGNAIEFIVKSNVTVNGKVVIAAGSIAEGTVKNVEKTCNKCKRDYCSKLELAVETVQAVDGQNIYVRSIPLVIKGNCRGAEATANIGATVSARIQNNVKINA